MGNYVLHFDFHGIKMDNVDTVLGYPWMTSMGTINVNIQKTFKAMVQEKESHIAGYFPHHTGRDQGGTYKNFYNELRGDTH